jgi:hypothetical protein
VPPPGPSWWKTPWPWIILAVLVAVVIAIVLVLVLGGDDEGTAESSPFRSALAPLAQANDALSAELLALDPGGEPAAARTAATAAEAATLEARTQVELVETEGAGATRTAVEDALDSESRYLAVVLSTIADPNELSVVDLAVEAEAVLEDWWVVDASAPGMRGSIAGFDDLAAWALDFAGVPPTD